MLQFTLSLFLSLLLLLVLLTCFHPSSTSVSAVSLSLSLSQYFSTVLLCEYVSLRRSLFLFPFQFFLLHASPSSFFFFVISYVPTSEFSRFLFVCVPFCQFFVCFVSISYICLLAKFIRFSFRFLFSMFSAFPLDSLLRFLSCYFFFSLLYNALTHSLCLRLSQVNLFIIKFTAHTVSLFSVCFSIWEHFRQSGKQILTHTLTLYFHVFFFTVSLTHTHNSNATR